jgi:hypothetical protein
MVMILVVCARKIMASSALVSSNFRILNFFGSYFNFFICCWGCYISTAESLRPDFSAGEEVERLAMTELIEVLLLFRTRNPVEYEVITLYDSMIFIFCQVISEENKSGPLIVLLKDVEKSFTGVTESLSSLRSKFESLPSGVLIIGSHTQMDSRKEKVHALLLRI